MQGTNYSSGTRDATGCTPIESLFCRGLVTQPGALKNVYDFNPGYGGPIVKDKVWWFVTARWTKAENYVPNDYPNANFVAGTDQPDASQPHDDDLRAEPEPAAPNDARRRRPLLGADGAAHVADERRRTSSASTTTTRSGSTRTASRPPRTKRWPRTYFFPFSDNLVQWSSPVSNKFLLEAGFWRHQETWGNRRAANDIADPLAVGVTDNNPVTLVPGYTQLINNYHGRVGATDTREPQPELSRQLLRVVRDRHRIRSRPASTSTAPSGGPTTTPSSLTATS